MIGGRADRVNSSVSVCRADPKRSDARPQGDSLAARWPMPLWAFSRVSLHSAAGWQLWAPRAMGAALPGPRPGPLRVLCKPAPMRGMRPLKETLTHQCGPLRTLHASGGPGAAHSRAALDRMDSLFCPSGMIPL